MQALIRLALCKQAELLDWLVREKPGVLADVAELEPRGVRVDTVADTSQAARHDFVPLAGRGDVDAQQHGSRAQRAGARPGRRDRQRNRLLTEELVAVALDLADQALAFLDRHVGREEPFLAAREQAA